MLSGVPSRRVLNDLLPLIFIASFIELLSARIVGRLSFHFAGNPLIAALYEVGSIMVRVTTILAFLGFILVALMLLQLRRITSIPLSALLLATPVIALFFPGYIYQLLLFTVLAMSLLIVLERERVGIATLAAILIAFSFLLSLSAMLIGSYPLLRLASEVGVLITSAVLFFVYRREGGLSKAAKAIGVGVPLLVLIAPNYMIATMPWTIRLVAAFSLGFLMSLPLEVYALALALFLLTVLRVSDPLTRYGLLLLLIGGLPQWSIYPLLLSSLGFILVASSFIAREKP